MGIPMGMGIPIGIMGLIPGPIGIPMNMGMRGPLTVRPFAKDMNFADGLRYPDTSQRSAVAC